MNKLSHLHASVSEGVCFSFVWKMKSPMWLNVVHSLSQLQCTPMHKYATFYLSILLLMDVWVLSIWAFRNTEHRFPGAHVSGFSVLAMWASNGMCWVLRCPKEMMANCFSNSCTNLSSACSTPSQARGGVRHPVGAQSVLLWCEQKHLIRDRHTVMFVVWTCEKRWARFSWLSSQLYLLWM